MINPQNLMPIKLYNVQYMYMYVYLQNLAKKAIS